MLKVFVSYDGQMVSSAEEFDLGTSLANGNQT
jgi:hypothetical protein